jgi:HlyD family secretion protein
VSSKPRTSSKGHLKPVHMMLALGGVILLLAYGVGPGGWFERTQEPELKGARVQRGPLTISVTERGNLKAADYVSLKSEIEGQSTILYLIPEGRHVQEGELLCELDATQLIDKRVQQEISLRNAEAAFVKSSQTYQIQVSQNESDIEKAKQKLEFAKQDKAKYLNGDKVLSEKKAEETIILSDEEHKRAQEKVDWSKKLAEKGFLTNTELEGDELSLTSAKIKLEQGQREQNILKEYSIPRQIATLDADLREAERELVRVKLQADARLVDFKADRDTNEAKLQLEKEKFAKLEKQIAKARIVAPKAGMVVYAKQEEQGRMGSAQPIQEGTTVRERQEIITIPTAGGMLATVSLHESVLKQVNPGQSCSIKVDALRGQEFHGQVSFVAVLPDQNSWWANPNTRLYTTTVAIFDASEEMRPGMSCAIEILVENIPDALYVPVQTVFRHMGGNVAFVQRGNKAEPQPVEVGQYNDKWVQILSGVAEGDVVLLSAPQNFRLQSGGPEKSAAEDGATPLTGEMPQMPPGPPGAAGANGAAEGGEQRGPRMGKNPLGDPGSSFRRGGEHGNRKRGNGERPDEAGADSGKDTDSSSQAPAPKPGAEAAPATPPKSSEDAKPSGGGQLERHDDKAPGAPAEKSAGKTGSKS